MCVLKYIPIYNYILLLVPETWILYILSITQPWRVVPSALRTIGMEFYNDVIISTLNYVNKKKFTNYRKIRSHNSLKLKYIYKYIRCNFTYGHYEKKTNIYRKTIMRYSRLCNQPMEFFRYYLQTLLSPSIFSFLSVFRDAN